MASRLTAATVALYKYATSFISGSRKIGFFGTRDYFKTEAWRELLINLEFFLFLQSHCVVYITISQRTLKVGLK